MLPSSPFSLGAPPLFRRKSALKCIPLKSIPGGFILLLSFLYIIARMSTDFELIFSTMARVQAPSDASHYLPRPPFSSGPPFSSHKYVPPYFFGENRLPKLSQQGCISSVCVRCSRFHPPFSSCGPPCFWRKSARKIVP